jgi:hypothetical protein
MYILGRATAQQLDRTVVEDGQNTNVLNQGRPNCRFTCLYRMFARLEHLPQGYFVGLTGIIKMMIVRTEMNVYKTPTFDSAFM